MMERQEALSLPFIVEKDKLVSWAAFPGHCDLQLKKGTRPFDYNHAALVKWGMARRKPCLILTDVMKTEHGKAYIERIKLRQALGHKGQVTNVQRESSLPNKVSPICRETRLSQRETRSDKLKTVMPIPKQRRISRSPQRTRTRRGSQSIENADDDEESKDIQEVIIGKDNGEDYRFAEVVDCGLSVCWEPDENNSVCDHFSASSRTDQEIEIHHNMKRKRAEPVSQYNGSGSPKRHRESVLRLTGEDRREGGPTPTRVCLEEAAEDCDLENIDCSIVQFTVGSPERTKVLVPLSPNLEAWDLNGTPRHSILSYQDNTTMTSPPEPIVLSSDDEEMSQAPQRCSPAVHPLVTVEDTVIQKQSLQEGLLQQQEDSDMKDVQVLRVVVEDFPRLVPVSPSPTVDYSCMDVAFSMLHCGVYQGKANGNITIGNQKILIPLKVANKQVEVKLTLERKELRRYSVWEHQELEALGLSCLLSKEHNTAPILLLCISEKAAADLQNNLCTLCGLKDEATRPGVASPFVLITLKEPLMGMEGALLQSVLEMDCLNSLTGEESTKLLGIDTMTDLRNLQSPLLSLDDSLQLIRQTGLDPRLLSLLGLECITSRPDKEEDSLPSVADKNIQSSPSEADLQKKSSSEFETVPELETVLEPDTELGTVPNLYASAELEVELNIEPELEKMAMPEIEQELSPRPEMKVKHKSEEEHPEQEHLSEKATVEAGPVYTLCHRRAKGLYRVSMCEPDSGWVKYKHQGLSRRLIQFPPPPLKGGITVTMEDLQCLDNGQYLNDVIIDFYLKYLLQESAHAVAERSHIFSSFFYKQLTRRDNASEGTTSEVCQRQRRHQRVKTWTRHVDIFKKDFLFVPVNQEAHWYLVVICFPGLDQPKFESWTGTELPTEDSTNGSSRLEDQEESQGSASLNDKTDPPSVLNHSSNLDAGTENDQDPKEPPLGPVDCTEKTCQKRTVCKRPCIIIMDSLKLSLHERVFKLLREYLQSEWEVRRGSSREFGPDQMKSSHCKVPLQDNSSDCGLYLLQYVESFLKDPVIHFELPIHLERWFPRQQVRRKREEIRDLVLKLYRYQNLDDKR